MFSVPSMQSRDPLHCWMPSFAIGRFSTKPATSCTNSQPHFLRTLQTLTVETSCPTSRVSMVLTAWGCRSSGLLSTRSSMSLADPRSGKHYSQSVNAWEWSPGSKSANSVYWHYHVKNYLCTSMRFIWTVVLRTLSPLLQPFKLLHNTGRAEIVFLAALWMTSGPRMSHRETSQSSSEEQASCDGYSTLASQDAASGAVFG